MKSKLFTKSLIAGALMMLMVPAAAMAQGPCYDGYRHMAWQQRDLARDRFQLRRDMAYGNWPAARAERADIRHDEWNLNRERVAQYRDYQRFGY